MSNRYYHRRPAASAVLAVCLGLLLAGHAPAAEYLFGYIGYGGNEPLTLALASGAPVVRNTDRDQGWWSVTDPNTPGNTNYVVGSLTISARRPCCATSSPSPLPAWPARR
jgi:hypothetical protein